MWGSILVAYTMISLMIFFLARVSPYERRSDNHDVTEKSDAFVMHTIATNGNAPFKTPAPSVLQGGGQPASDRFTILNSFWYTLTGFFMQQTGVSPKAVSVRFLTAFWWMFCLVILALYLITLSSFMVAKSGNDNTPREQSFQQFMDDPNTRLAVVGRGASYHLIKVPPYTHLYLE